MSASAEADFIHPIGWWQGRRALIAGGMGFIGSNLARRLVALGAVVTVVDHLLPQFGGNRANVAGLEERIRIEIFDVGEAGRLPDLIAGQEVLFNLAGQSSHLDSMTDPLTDLHMNAAAQLTLLEACRLGNPEIRVVFASTRQIYGRPQALPVAETHPLRPVDINGIHKLAAEQYHLLYHQVYGMHTCALRLTNTYGPRMRIRDARQTFLGVWIKAALEGRAWEVWGGKQLRDFTYVDDAVEAFLLAAQDPRAEGRIFNLGGSEVVSLRELAELLVEVNEGGAFESREFPENRRRIDIGDYHADGTLIRDTLGWRPQTPLRTGLKHTLEYFRTHLPQYQ